MSDDKKSGKKEPPEPLENPKIWINVDPKDRENPEHQKTAERVSKNLKEKVEKAIEQNKPGGKEKQFEAVESETKKAGEGTSQKEIEKIKVYVSDEDKDGDGAGRGWAVTPKEDKPAS